jgi:type I pantothenate kinase
MPPAGDETISALEPVADVVRARLAVTGPPVVAGVAGSVAVGKSTVARALAFLLEPLRVDVVSTDGFLYPNAVLEERHLVMRKGFPESYDVAALQAFVAAVRTRAPEVVAPVYSHVHYDIVPAGRQVVRDPDVLVLEGVNALTPALDGLVDVGIFIDAAEHDVRRWFAERFVSLAQAATDDPTSFFAQWATLDTAALEALAGQVWDAINGVNLRDHILPTRDRAAVIVAKAPDHTVSDVIVRRDG